MSETKVVVPEGMLEAAVGVLDLRVPPGNIPYANETCNRVLEAALRWLAENPMVPTPEQWSECLQESVFGFASEKMSSAACEEWQRRMFRAPKPGVPEEIRDLLWNDQDQFTVRGRTFDEAVLEAYHRGLEARK